MEKKSTHIMYGFIIGIIMVVIGLVQHLSGMKMTSGMQYIGYIPLLAGLILNAIAFSKANDAFVTFGEVFKNCFKATMVATLIMVAWSLIAIAAFPEMKERAIETAHEEMMKNPQMTDEIMDMSLNFTRKYWNAILIASAIFGTMLYGAICSLIAAAIAKKKGAKPITADNF